MPERQSQITGYLPVRTPSGRVFQQRMDFALPFTVWLPFQRFNASTLLRMPSRKMHGRQCILREMSVYILSVMLTDTGMRVAETVAETTHATTIRLF
jgi:hypothetical protein